MALRNEIPITLTLRHVQEVALKYQQGGIHVFIGCSPTASWSIIPTCHPMAPASGGG
jgi:hypothetical protein